MSPDSITERQFMRSVNFDTSSKEEALRQTVFYQEQIGYYLANVFNDRSTYNIDCIQRFDTDRVYTIRKGSAVLTVDTVFGINTSYKEQPPRKFYTFTTTATHRNEILDNTDKVNDVIEWTCRITGGLVLGILFAVGLALIGGHLAGHFIFMGFAGGSAVGGFIGQLVARNLYATMERRLEQKGEITAVEKEWDMLTETLAIVFGNNADDPVNG